MAKRILMVCTGNICRSVMAHAVLDQQLRAAGIEGIRVDSAGVSDEEAGNPPDSRARRVLAENGYSVPSHRARQVSADDFAQCDLMLAMTKQHLRVLFRLAKRYGHPDADLRLYRSFDIEGEGDVPDPWYGGYSDFEDTMDVIARVTPRIIAQYQ